MARKMLNDRLTGAKPNVGGDATPPKLPKNYTRQAGASVAPQTKSGVGALAKRIGLKVID
jgi:hypothetical protein